MHVCPRCYGVKQVTDMGFTVRVIVTETATAAVVHSRG